MGKQRAMDDPTVRVELTERQVEVLRGIARGRTNAEIAEELGVSLDGVKWHVREILQRLGADSREEAAELWKQEHSLRNRIAGWFGWPLAVGAGGAAAVGVAAFVLVGSFGGGDGGRTVTPPESTATPAPEEALSVFATGEPVDADEFGLSHSNFEEGSIRHLATHGEADYYAALRDQRGERVCLVAILRDELNDGMSAVSCPTFEYFSKLGAMLGFEGRGSMSATAYLLPDGYADSAHGVPGTELVTPNLVVVTDPDATPEDFPYEYDIPVTGTPSVEDIDIDNIELLPDD